MRPVPVLPQPPPPPKVTGYEDPPPQTSPEKTR